MIQLLFGFVLFFTSVLSFADKPTEQIEYEMKSIPLAENEGFVSVYRFQKEGPTWVLIDRNTIGYLNEKDEIVRFKKIDSNLLGLSRLESGEILGVDLRLKSVVVVRDQKDVKEYKISLKDAPEKAVFAEAIPAGKGKALLMTHEKVGHRHFQKRLYLLTISKDKVETKLVFTNHGTLIDHWSGEHYKPYFGKPVYSPEKNEIYFSYSYWDEKIKSEKRFATQKDGDRVYRLGRLSQLDRKEVKFDHYDLPDRGNLIVTSTHLLFKESFGQSALHTFDLEQKKWTTYIDTRGKKGEELFWFYDHEYHAVFAFHVENAKEGDLSWKAKVKFLDLANNHLKPTLSEYDFRAGLDRIEYLGGKLFIRDFGNMIDIEGEANGKNFRNRFTAIEHPHSLLDHRRFLIGESHVLIFESRTGSSTRLVIFDPAFNKIVFNQVVDEWKLGIDPNLGILPNGFVMGGRKSIRIARKKVKPESKKEPKTEPKTEEERDF